MSKPLISVKNLSHAFGAGPLRREVLRSVSADFFPGEIVIITGPSGAGKTTFLTLVGALRGIQSGSVSVDGLDLHGGNKNQMIHARRKMGFVFQAHNLVASLTAWQNVAMALAFLKGEDAVSARKKAVEMLGKVGLAEHADKRPAMLSGGQKQRVAIARALVRGPSIIMADEPTASLDRQSGREVVELLKQLARNSGCAILLVTHDNRILDIADRIIKIEDGVMEETYAGMDRIYSSITAMTETVSRYTSFLSAGKDSFGELAAASASFEKESEDVNRRTAEMINRNLPAFFAARALALQKLLNKLVSLELCARDFVRLVVSDGADGVLPNFKDSFVQSLDFLFTTLRSAVTQRDAGEIEMLLTMTSPKSDIIKKIREDYSASKGDLPEEIKIYLFDFTNTYARIVYDMRLLVAGLRELSAAAPGPGGPSI
jgi:putative ABC transport system ATP-binding protein